MLATKSSPEVVAAAKASLKAASESKFSPAETTDTPDTDSQDMSLAAFAIFSGATNTFTTSKGKTAIVKQATMKQLPVVLKFFQEIVGGLDQTALVSLIDMYADRQRKALANGEDPNAIEAGPEDDSEVLVGKVFGNVSLLTQLLASAATVLPELVQSFTNLTEEEYEELSPDEGLTLVGAIFLLNYGFFSQNLVPIFQAFMRNVGRKKAVENVPTKGQIRRRK